MYMKKEDYIALGKWVKDNSYLQIPANKVDDYFVQLEKMQAEVDKLKKQVKILEKEAGQTLTTLSKALHPDRRSY